MRQAKAAKSRMNFTKLKHKDQRVCSRYEKLIDGTDANVDHGTRPGGSRGNGTFNFEAFFSSLR